MSTSFTLFDDEVLPLDDILELVDFEENNPEESEFNAEHNLQYRIFLSRIASEPTPAPDPSRTYTLLPWFSPVREMFGERKIKAKKKKKCTNGQVCGFSCISKTKVCKANMTTAELKAHNAAKRAEKKAAKGGGGGAANQPQQSFTGENNGVKHKPFMTEAEANEYVKGSVLADQDFFHGTTKSGAQAITGDGVDIDANRAALYGRGFYMGGGSDGFAIGKAYAEQYTGKDEDPEVLSMKVLSNKPLIVDRKGHSDMIARGVAEGKIPSEYHDYIKGSKRPDGDLLEAEKSYRDGITSYAKSLGYDSLYITDERYLVAFDAKQVAVFKRTKIDVEKDEDFDVDIDALIN